MTKLNTYSPDNQTLTYNEHSYSFYIGRSTDIRLEIALEVLDFASGKKTLQEVVENINEIKESK